MSEANPNTLTTLQRWHLASRPKTLPAAVSPVLVGWAIALDAGSFEPLPALATLLIAVLIQIGANLVNDVSDYQKGADTEERLGPLRVTQAGLLTVRQMWTGVFVVLGAAALAGLYLVIHTGWPVLFIGAASLAGALLYSVGRYSFAATGSADFFSMLFFGFAAVCGTVYVLVGSVPLNAWLAAVPVGALVTAILVVNNVRDIESDRRAGRKTIPARFGRRAGEIEYVALLGLAYLSAIALWATGEHPWVLLTWFSLPLAGQRFQDICNLPIGREFNKLLAQTARLTLLYSLLLALGILL